MSDAEEYIIRDGRGDDLAFIYSTWTKSYRCDSDVAKGCRDSTFYSEYSKVIDQILSHPDTEIKVAALKSDPLVIYGYFVSQGEVGHYTFVKESFWNLGIASKLWNSCGHKISEYSHRTHTIRPILDRKNVIYNPFILFKKKDSL